MTPITSHAELICYLEQPGQHWSAQLLPVLESPLWLQDFEHLADDAQRRVATGWLYVLNQKSFRYSFLAADKLVTLLNTHYRQLAHFKPYFPDDDTIRSELPFNGSLRSLRRLVQHNLPYKTQIKFEQLLNNLWFGNPTNQKKALLAFPHFYDTATNETGQLQKLGCLVAHLAWDLVNTQQLNAEYQAAAARISIDAGYELVPLEARGDVRHQMWHALAHACFQDRIADFTQFNGVDFVQLCQQQPLAAALPPFSRILWFYGGSCADAKLTGTIPTPCPFLSTHPDAQTVYDILRKWFPACTPVWDVAEATDMWHGDACTMALLTTSASVSVPVSLPDDLNLATY